jgi:hypothetical protein
MAPKDEMCRGGWGESARNTIIDLTKRSDLALVHRAVVNGWDVPSAIRVQIVDQIDAALAAAAGNPRRVVRLGRLMLAMEARNQIADGLPRSKVRELLRKRQPVKRRPRTHHWGGSGCGGVNNS